MNIFPLRAEFHIQKRLNDYSANTLSGASRDPTSPLTWRVAALARARTTVAGCSVANQTRDAASAARAAGLALRLVEARESAG